MSEKVARAVGGTPRRRFGFGTGLTVLAVVVVMLATGALAATPATHTATAATRGTHHSRATKAKTNTPVATTAQTTSQRQATTQQSSTSQQQSAPLPTQAQANAYANSELGKLTVPQKFGQLTMAGPTTPLSVLEQQACSGEVGSVLDLTGITEINDVHIGADGPPIARYQAHNSRALCWPARR